LADERNGRKDGIQPRSGETLLEEQVFINIKPVGAAQYTEDKGE